MPHSQTTGQRTAPRGRDIEHPCADPETFVRGGPTLTSFLVDEKRDDPNTTKNGTSSSRQQNAI